MPLKKSLNKTLSLLQRSRVLLSRWLEKVNVKTRLTLLFVTLFGGTLFFFSFVMFDFMAKALEKEFDDALFNYAVDVADSIVLDPSGDLAFSNPLVDQEKIFPFPLGNALIQVRHISGNVLSQIGPFGALQLPYEREFRRLARGEEVAYSTAQSPDDDTASEKPKFRVIHFPIDNSEIPQLILQIAVPTTFLEGQIDNRKYILETVIPALLLISTLAAYLLSSRAMVPVQRMINAAQSIHAHELSQRVPVPPAKDEIQNLALTLNEMLERIDRAFQSQERFVADASHQLLTPLTIVKGELEQSLKHIQKDNEQMETALTSCLQEVDHLATLVKDLLLLARVDAGLEAFNFTHLYLDEVILEAMARAEKVARTKKVRLQFRMQEDPDLRRPKILGEEDLLMNLVFNLIENAIKYSPEDNVVIVALSWDETHQFLTVEDFGPGLSPEILANMFDRFSRGAQASRSTSGYGLGLAIAKKISELHGAEIWAANKASQGALLNFKIKHL